MLRRVKNWAVPLGLTVAALSLPPEALAADTTNDSGIRTRSTGHRGSQSPVVFSADEVTHDDDLGITIARGNVEMAQSGKIVLADVISYNERTDTVTASGNVTLIDAGGDTTFANYAELYNEMHDGFITDIRMLMADRSRLAGNTARRTNGSRVELRKAIYSPCDLCASDPTAPPLWDLQAETMVHDADEKIVEYNNVTLDFMGVPILWSPYLSHPDPSVKRASGFLPATIGTSSLLGANVSVPYYYVIDDSSDATIEPIFTASQGAILTGEYRQRFADGQFYARGSVTNSNLGVSDNLEKPNSEIRGNISAHAVFDLDADFRTGFDLDRTTDPTYLRIYKFGGNENFLNSRAYLEDFDGRDYGSVTAYDFQTLRVGISDRDQPIILPQVQYTWAGRPQAWGGQFTTSVSALDLLREQGSGYQRLSAGTEMDFPFSAPFGQRFNFVAGIRADGYNYQSQQLGQALSVGVDGLEYVPAGPLTNGTTGRLFPQIGLEWRDPWVRRGDGSYFVIEPRAAIYAAPIGGNPAAIPNIDNQAFDFDETDLFTRNRMAGYDQVDGGQRVDYGLSGAWYSDAGPNVRFLVGQSYQFQTNGAYTPGTGLEHANSDYVGRIAFNPINTLDLTYRFRFSEADLRAERQEINILAGPQNIKVSFNYQQLAGNIRDQETARQQVSAGLNLVLTDYWSMNLHVTRDLDTNSPLLASGIGVQYVDECLTFVGSLSEDGTVIQNVRPGTVLLFQFVFKNLGEIDLPAFNVMSASS